MKKPIMVQPNACNFGDFGLPLPAVLTYVEVDGEEKVCSIAQFSRTADGGSVCVCGYYISGNYNRIAELEHRVEHLERLK